MSERRCLRLASSLPFLLSSFNSDTSSSSSSFFSSRSYRHAPLGLRDDQPPRCCCRGRPQQRLRAPLLGRRRCQAGMERRRRRRGSHHQAVRFRFLFSLRIPMLNLEHFCDSLSLNTDHVASKALCASGDEEKERPWKASSLSLRPFFPICKVRRGGLSTPTSASLPPRSHPPSLHLSAFTLYK